MLFFGLIYLLFSGCGGKIITEDILYSDLLECEKIVKQTYVSFPIANRYYDEAFNDCMHDKGYYKK